MPAIRGERVPLLTGAGAARFRRGVPIAAHVARVHQRRRADARSSPSPAASRSKARRRRRQPRDGAGARRLARAADRRRHAPARACTSTLGVENEHRPVAPARRPGARARRGAAHDRAEPVRDHRRPHAAQSVRAARVGAHEELAREPRAAGRSTGSIIDTPPVLAVTDAVILAPHVSCGRLRRSARR